ncbi:carbohydrate-binding family 9-like protein [Paenibacillus sp. Marseille-Q4541]|uniref:carbohydrate-binding family 9-like protein n=1 Tax=Paenibacillus sp. Marseille-Q4541 TaxID=2831522 RepID=UPI001BA63A44|nr:carbohydrate-binding family 9-like protein [Paenibacillus sp. Marseille-Q4541]
MMDKEYYVYLCKQVEAGWNSIDWDRCEVLQLCDTVTGLPPKESTEVRVCWNKDYLYVRFLCEDQNIVSDYTKRDDPLYEQDVVEFFIDEEGKGTHYLELEVSPRNVVFDALIENDGVETITGTNKAWCFNDLITSVDTTNEGYVTTFIRIPASNFIHPLQEGLRWKVNFYRIDEDVEGIREYQAWSPTEKVNFHIPSTFGTMIFSV